MSTLTIPETLTGSTASKCFHEESNAFHEQWIKSFGECWEDMQGLQEHNQEDTASGAKMCDLPQKQA